ncbi:MAG: hypothetical protein LBU39_11770 [Desulfobulbaceae bacterium]|jgi:hypothetical protein|nr:hypothetical protein [Desulfobulbaceae bacterium]
MKITPYFALAAVFILALSGCARLYSLALPNHFESDAVALPEIATLDGGALNEPSALQRSRRFPGLFWTVNDSGGKPELFALNHQGRLIQPTNGVESVGIAVSPAKNIDWESLAADERGNLYLADIGNNLSQRRDLTIYQIAEPDPRHDLFVVPSRVITFSYPEQQTFPDAQLRFDAEALFWLDGHLHLFTKHWKDRDNALYRLDISEKSDEARAVFIGVHRLGGMVTAADATPDGRRLAVLTYGGVWLFARDGKGDFFTAPARWLPIRAKQVEGIAFADDTGNELWLINEQRELFKVETGPNSPGWRFRKLDDGP